MCSRSIISLSVIAYVRSHYLVTLILLSFSGSLSSTSMNISVVLTLISAILPKVCPCDAGLLSIVRKMFIANWSLLDNVSLLNLSPVLLPLRNGRIPARYRYDILQVAARLFYAPRGTNRKA